MIPVVPGNHIVTDGHATSARPPRCRSSRPLAVGRPRGGRWRDCCERPCRLHRFTNVRGLLDISCPETDRPPGRGRHATQQRVRSLNFGVGHSTILPDKIRTDCRLSS